MTWTDHRELAETIGQSVVEAVAAAVGTDVELGIAETCVPEQMLDGRPTPVRGIVVRFGRPLRDVLVFVSSLREDVIRPLVEVAAASAIAALEVPTDADEHGPLGTFVVEDALQFDTPEEALEQCDALFLEASYTMDLPTGQLVMVVGTGLLESAAALQAGRIDEFAEGPAWIPPGASAPADAAEAPAATSPADEFLVAEAAPVEAVPVSAIDELDAALAREEADAAATAAVVPAAAAPTPDPAASQRWTQLLSGVEVELSAELGRTDLALGEIASLATDNVLTLQQLVDEPVVVYVNGTPYARARLVVVDGEYGIEIVDVLEAGQLVSSLAA